MKSFFCSGLLLLGAAASAPAAIIYNGVQDIVVPFTFDGVYLNVVTGDTAWSQPGTWESAPWINLFFGGVGIASDDLVRPVVADAGGRVLNLVPGATVDGSATFALSPNGLNSHIGAGADQFKNGELGYLGFSFLATPMTSQPSFGWLAFTPSNIGGAVIHAWAYQEDELTPILVGAIPEPSAWAAMAGLAGIAVAGFRRRAVRTGRVSN